MTKRKPAIFVGRNLLCGDCRVKLNPQFDTQAEGDGNCWSCPCCDEWFTISGEPAITGTCEPEKSE
jgi:hypothetical protein